MAKSKPGKTTDEGKPASRASKAPPMMFKALTHAEIAQRAFELYMQRPASEGTPESDWVKAELELRATIIDSN